MTYDPWPGEFMGAVWVTVVLTGGGVDSVWDLQNTSARAYDTLQVNGSGVPTSAPLVGTNSSGQFVAAGVLPASAEPAHTGDATNTAGSLSMTVKGINGTSLAGLTTGLLKNTTTTGVPTIAVAGVDYALPGAVSPAASINAQTGTSYTLLASDNGKVITFNNAAAITLTVAAGLGTGFNCLVVQIGAGLVTPTASGTTIRQRQSLTKTAGLYAIATLVSYVADTFALAGDLQ